MVKNKPGTITRRILGLTVIALVAVAAVVVLATRSKATARGAHKPPAGGPTATTRPTTATAPPATSTAPSASPAPTTGTAVSHEPQPLGVAGRWKLVFNDSFNGSSLNRTVWNAHNGWTNQNATTASLGNVTVRNGDAILTLASDRSGAEIGTRRFGLKVGEFAEARIKFAGNGSTIYNWPAFWLSGPEWPRGGENDIAEGFGALTISYHSPAVTRHSGPIPGDWANHFHIFGIYRGRWQSHVYWDGKLIANYDTDDDGQPEMLLLTLGAGREVRTGAAGAMVVDYVRAWAPAPGH